jgi:hypothetical protein
MSQCEPFHGVDIDQVHAAKGLTAPRYIGCKLITAEPMTRAEYNTFRGWQLPADENGDDEGYLVEYQDGGAPNVAGRAGYVSWSPKEQFDNAYRRCDAMPFGLALEALKRGQCVARTGWNGKGLFAYLVPANAYPAQTGAAKAHFGEAALVPYNAYFALKQGDGTISTWAPSVGDALAEDWLIVDPLQTKTYADGTRATGPAPLPDASPLASRPAYQQRVLDEKGDLDEKMTKLEAFAGTGLFAGLDIAEQSRLMAQYGAMRAYSASLGERIAAFATE